MLSDNPVVGALAAGEQIGDRFNIGKPLGRGGFAITYLAQAGSYNKEYAIKEFLPMTVAMRQPDGTVAPTGDAEREIFQRGLDDFVREGRRLLECRHPSIVGVEDFFEERGTAYLVMEYVEGSTLQAFLSTNGPMGGEQVVNMLIPVAEALGVLHSKDMLHRDLSPANIMLRSGSLEPVLIDFGAARQTDALRTHLRANTVANVISDGYSPPEQYRTHGRQGPSSDIYALGCVAYRALTGTRPPTALDRAMGTDPTIDWNSRFPNFKGRLLVPIISKMIDLEPDARYQSTAELRNDLLELRSLWNHLNLFAAGETTKSILPIEGDDGKLRLTGTVTSREAVESALSMLTSAAPNVAIIDEVEIRTEMRDAAASADGTMTEIREPVARPDESPTRVTRPGGEAAETPDAAATRLAGSAPASVGPDDAATQLLGSAAGGSGALGAATQLIGAVGGGSADGAATRLIGSAGGGSGGPGAHAVTTSHGQPSAYDHPEARRSSVSPVVILTVLACITAVGAVAAAYYIDWSDDGPSIRVSGTSQDGPFSNVTVATGQPANSARPTGSSAAQNSTANQPGTATNNNAANSSAASGTGASASTSATGTSSGSTNSGAGSSTATTQVANNAEPTRNATTNPATSQPTALSCTTQLDKQTFRIGEPFAFTVMASQNSEFLVYTIDTNDKVELHIPQLARLFMGSASLLAGQPRRIPIPSAPGGARIKGPPGTYNVCTICGKEDLGRFGFTGNNLNNVARQGRDNFEAMINENMNRADRSSVNRGCVSYTVTASSSN